MLPRREEVEPSAEEAASAISAPYWLHGEVSPVLSYKRVLLRRGLCGVTGLTNDIR